MGGLRGPFLVPFVKDKIQYIKNKYDDVEVVAGGGIQNIKTLNKYKELGADHFSISSVCFNPINFIILYYNYIQKHV